MKRQFTRRNVLAAGFVGSVAGPRIASARSSEVPADWPMHQRDPANTGRSPSQDAPTNGVRVAWRASTGSNRPTDPVVADGTAFVGNDTGMQAYDADDGMRLWTQDVGVRPVGVPAVANETVYFGIDYEREQPKVHALDATDGSLRWRSEATSILPIVTVHDGIVYARGQEKFCAIDAKTGETVWTHEKRTFGQVAPAIAAGSVFTTSDGAVRALDPADGTERWRFEAPASFNGAVTVADGTVYVAYGNGAGRLVALDAADGEEQWRSALEYHAAESPVVSDGRVYVGTAQLWVSAFDAADGTRLWRTENRGVNATSPAVASDTLYFSSLDKHVYALSTSDGSQRWRFGTGDSTPTSSAVANGRVYVGAGDGTLYALGPSRTSLSIPGFGVLGGIVAVGAAAARRLSSSE